MPVHATLLVLVGLCLAAGLFFGILAARGFASEEKDWHKKLFTALSFSGGGNDVVQPVRLITL
jgi:hypothetical protein